MVVYCHCYIKKIGGIRCCISAVLEWWHYILFPCHIYIIYSASFLVSLYCAVILFTQNSKCIFGIHIPMYCTVCLLHNVLSLHLCLEFVILYLDDSLNQIVFLMHQFFHFLLPLFPKKNTGVCFCFFV